MKEAIDRLIECARLLGTTQAKKGAGTYTQQDSRFESAMYESIAAHRKSLEEALAKQEQGEPVAIYQYRIYDGSWIDQEKHSYDYNKLHAPNATVRVVYTTPQQRKPLTDEQIYEIHENSSNLMEFTRAIEAAHGIAPQGSDNK